MAMSYDGQGSHYLVSWPFVKQGNYTGTIDPERKTSVGYLVHAKTLTVVEMMKQCNFSVVSVKSHSKIDWVHDMKKCKGRLEIGFFNTTNHIQNCLFTDQSTNQILSPGYLVTVSVYRIREEIISMRHTGLPKLAR